MDDVTLTLTLGGLSARCMMYLCLMQAVQSRCDLYKPSRTTVVAAAAGSAGLPEPGLTLLTDDLLEYFWFIISLLNFDILQISIILGCHCLWSMTVIPNRILLCCVDIAVLDRWKHVYVVIEWCLCVVFDCWSGYRFIPVSTKGFTGYFFQCHLSQTLMLLSLDHVAAAWWTGIVSALHSPNQRGHFVARLQSREELSWHVLVLDLSVQCHPSTFRLRTGCQQTTLFSGTLHVRKLIPVWWLCYS